MGFPHKSLSLRVEHENLPLWLAALRPHTVEKPNNVDPSCWGYRTLRKKDTQGCILVGRNQRVGEVLESRKWLYELKMKIVEAKGRGEAVWLTIK